MDKWEPVKNQYGVVVGVRCPICKRVIPLHLKRKWCVICSAEMVGEDERTFTEVSDSKH